MQPIVDHRQSDAILGAMRQIALAGGTPLSHADTASILAAARYLLCRPGIDVGALGVVRPNDLVAALRGSDLKAEAVKYLTVMTLVEGRLDTRKIAYVLDYARALDVEASYLTELVEAASGHMAWSLADMTRQNMESITGKPWGKDQDVMAWLMPYAGSAADPGLASRYEMLGRLPDGSFGKALWEFYKINRYAFPGDPAALNERFATPHDSTHVISGYDTSARGEILVSTFTAAMHPINPMAGHILPVLFSWHLDIKINDVAKSTSGGLDPEEFWHAWARGHKIKADLFVEGWQVWHWIERDLEDLRAELGVTPPGTGTGALG
jgi:hypothetical protein